MTKSCVLIVPDEARIAAGAFAAAHGWQPPGASPGMFCAALTDDGATITHWGARPDIRPEHEAMLNSPPPDAAPLLAVMIWDIAQDGAWGSVHFDAVLAAHGLSRFDPGGP